MEMEAPDSQLELQTFIILHLMLVTILAIVVSLLQLNLTVVINLRYLTARPTLKVVQEA